VTPPSPTYHSLQEAQIAAGRDFDFVYRFHDVDDKIPDSDDHAILASGKIMHITIDARDYAKPAEKAPRWSEFSSGAYDSELVSQARGIASIKKPVFVTFDHEPDAPRKSRRGSPADYVAAWRHVHDLFQREHVTNAVWVWVATGWIPSADTALRMWPGNDDVDWISWEVYDNAGCKSGHPDAALSRGFPKLADKFLTYLKAHGRPAGIDIKKPMMISEAGSAVTPNKSGPSTWYRSIPTFLKNHPQIKAIGLWDHKGREKTCRFSFSSDRGRSKDVSTAGQSKWVNPLTQLNKS
jgi:hypothetical protein